MKITDARVIVCSPGRNFVTLKIETDEKVYGVGDATLNGRELAVASYLRDHIIPLLSEKDPSRIEDIWHFLYKGAYWRRGPVTMAAIGAVDLALWDIKGKVLNTPVYNLLGGLARSGVMAYGHASGEQPDQALEAAARYLDIGYKAVRVQSGFEGLPSAYGIGRDGSFYEPVRRRDGLAEEQVWAAEPYLRQVPELFRRAREELGPDVHLLHDAHHRLTPIEAARLGKDLEPHRLFWLEDAVPAENIHAFQIIRNHTTTPLAVGEVFNTIYDCADLINRHLIDYIRTTVAHAGGLTHMLRIAHLAELNHVKTGCHGPSDLSPINLAACIHLGVAVHNFGIQEFMRHPTETESVFSSTYRFSDGYLYPGDAPGLGVDIDEDEAAKYPYARAYLPVARKLDGTVHSW